MPHKIEDAQVNLNLGNKKDFLNVRIFYVIFEHTSKKLFLVYPEILTLTGILYFDFLNPVAPQENKPPAPVLTQLICQLLQVEKQGVFLSLLTFG